MRHKKRQVLDYWLKSRYPWEVTNIVSVEPEPWVCPGYSPIQESRTRSTVLDFNYDPVCSECDAAQIVGRSFETLKKWRQRSRGPAYIQYGKNGVVRYSLSELRAFLNLPHELSIPNEDPFFDERGAAIILGVEAATLKKWRQQNRGPAFRRRQGTGRISYRLSALMGFRSEWTVEPRRPKEVNSKVK